ncbi:hypothetical protein ACIBH1_44600 [Nonomuraea sp. NPDC050663]|uniref:hypothetical protein n=1 Tax=Nonomuraea sp. NPDC050663 TaxID=3364370 RepID=UPI0037B2C3C4
MNRKAAREVALARLAEWESVSPETLLEILPDGESILETIIESNGRKWLVRTTAFWEDEGARQLRVTVSVDDGGLLSGIFPVSASSRMQM